MPKKPSLSVVSSSDLAIAPPRPLSEAGLSLWRRVTGAYDISDEGGREILYQACAAADRVAELEACIARDGAIVQSRSGPKEHPGLRQELANRAFITRSLARLGLDVEPIRPIGRPPGSFV